MTTNKTDIDMKKQPTTQYDKFIDAVLINDVEKFCSILRI